VTAEASTASRDLRLATLADVPAIESLIARSVRVLQAPYYSSEQREGALGSVFGVDRRLIEDGTYFVIEFNQTMVACGGWSRRKVLFGSDGGRAPADDAFLNPERDPARVRAFFVEPTHARRGLGRRLLLASEEALCRAGFGVAELVATLAGEPLYAAGGYAVLRRYDLTLSNGLPLPVVHMRKSFASISQRNA
jgi:GNAT superfamily N-acetyltransferase